MFQKICKYCITNRSGSIFVRHNSQVSGHINNKPHNIEISPREIEKYEVAPTVTKSVLEPLQEDISHVAPYLKPTFNFAAYINKSETLQQLLKLGVNLHKLEKNVEAVPFILGLKFENIKDHIVFLSDLGLEQEDIGHLITKNPLLLKEDLENLKVRINYLEFKKFTSEMITQLIKVNPLWLTHSTQQIDEQLGFFQNEFHLSGNEVRSVAVHCPKLVTTKISSVKASIFVLKEEMGFSSAELKKILLKKPIIFIRGTDRMLKSFEYLHRNMDIPLERIVEEPEILTCRQRRLMERHSFLVKLGRAQYDPKKPNYVALTTLVSGTDSYFATEIAKSSIQTYNAYLKSL